MNRVGLLLSAVLAVALLAPAVSDAALPSLPGGIPGGAGITQYMPKDSTVVISLNVSKLADAGLFEMVGDMANNMDDLEGLEALGVDIEKDIKQVMFALVVNAEDFEEDPEVYVAFAGNLPSEEKFVKVYTEEEGKAPDSKQIKGKTVFDIDGEVQMCFLPGVVLLVPTEDAESDITKMLAGATGSMTANPALASLMGDVNTKATVWAVVNVTKEIREAIAEEGDAEGMPFDITALKTVAASFDYAENVSLDVTMNFDNGETPASLVEEFNMQAKQGAEAMAQMMPDIAKLMGAIKAEADGTKAKIGMKLGREEFDAAVESVIGMMFGSMMGGPGPVE